MAVTVFRRSVSVNTKGAYTHSSNGNETIRKLRFNKQNDNFAQASLFLVVNFFAITARQ